MSKGQEQHEAKPLSVFLADDHTLILKGLKLLLSNNPSIEVIGESQDGNETVQLVKELKPDVLITDISMPGMDISVIRTSGLSSY